MNKLIIVSSLSLLFSACSAGPEGGITGTDTAASTDPILGAAINTGVETSSLDIDQDFDFAAARTIDISFDIADARSDKATVTICNDYEKIDNDFDINFTSCTVNGELVSGLFDHSMEVTIDKTAVIAGVFFQDPSKAPLFKEFSVDDGTQTRSKGNVRKLVWQQ